MKHAAALGSRETSDESTDISLRESEARFRGTFENAAVGIAHVGLDGRWLRVNDKLCAIVGYDRAELLALTFQDITWAEDLAADIAFMQQMMAGTIRTYSMEKRYVRKDRSLVWINLTASLVRTHGGTPDYFIAVVEDISARKAAEAALRESEARVRALADNMSQLAWMADRNGARTWCNRRWFDYIDEHAAGWEMLRPTQDWPAGEAEFVQRFSAGEAWSDTYGLAGKSGELRLFLTRVVPLHDERGQIVQWLGTHTDVTAEVEARRVRELARFFELSLDLACVVSVTGRFVHVNPEFQHVLGYSREELLTIPIMTLVHPGDHAATMEELAKLRTGNPLVAFTNRYLCKDGRYRWLQWRAAPVVDGLIYALARDVTADREIMEALRTTHDHYRLITDNVTDYSLILLDREGRVLTWNAGAQRLLGYTAEEMVGEHMSKGYHARGEGQLDATAILERAVGQGRCEVECERVRKDGSTFWGNMVVTALRNAEGVLQGFAKITRDFSQRHQTELDLRAHEASLATSLREREVLLQEVHHRVKNNLQVISSLMNMQLRMLDGNTAATRALQECRSRVEAIGLIHEQLYQSQDYTQIPFDQYLTNLARNVFRGASDALGRVTLRLDLEPIAFTVDRAIPCGLMLNELLTNAVKHAFPNGRAGEVQVGLHAKGSTVEITVADDGVGIPEAKRGDLMNSLGMELVSLLVEQIQGELQVSHGAGTTFRVVCPLEAH
ncbi:MAG TPA: PAS domain S-box protein [Polyangiales bacterium]|nr:PAS domain S-box protein [Polyangiales bacterium]